MRISELTSFENRQDYAQKIRSERNGYIPRPGNDIFLVLRLP